jgi:hypothetical protein
LIESDLSADTSAKRAIRRQHRHSLHDRMSGRKSSLSGHEHLYESEGLSEPTRASPALSLSKGRASLMAGQFLGGLRRSAGVARPANSEVILIVVKQASIHC